jgi:lambda repressor-like predicted transcriptional regulator
MVTAAIKKELKRQGMSVHQLSKKQKAMSPATVWRALYSGGLISLHKAEGLMRLLGLVVVPKDRVKHADD